MDGEDVRRHGLVVTSRVVEMDGTLDGTLDGKMPHWMPQ